MEPVTIVAALTTAAGLLAKGALGEAGKDAYKAMRDYLRTKFGVGADTAVTALETAPESEPLQKLLMDQLVSTQAAHDETLLRLAEKLVEAIKTTSAGQEAMVKFNIHAENSEIGNIGDNAHIEGGIHFGTSKGDKC